MTNRRAAQRYRVELPLEFDRGSGVTQDVSVSGVFFRAAETRQVGEWIECCLFLRSAEPGQNYLRFEGRVVRVEPCGNHYGIAAQFEALQPDLQFLTGSGDPSVAPVTH